VIIWDLLLGIFVPAKMCIINTIIFDPFFLLSRPSSIVYRNFIKGRGYRLGGSPLSSLVGSFGSNLRGRFGSSLGSRLGSRLRGRFGVRLLSGLVGKLGSRLGSRQGGSLVGRLGSRLVGWDLSIS
jgi:hypothetical protein